MVVLAVASAAVYLLAFTLPFSLATYAARPHLTLGEATGHGAEGLALFATAVIALFTFQLCAARSVVRLPPVVGRRAALAGTALCSLALLFAQPTLSVDLYDYLAQGSVLALHGANPFQVGLARFRDPLVRYAGWPDLPSPYGPAWQAITSLLVLSGVRLAGQLFLLKLLAALALLAILAFTGRALRALAPDDEALAMVVLGWNPLVLLELVGNGHNDALMLALVALALALVVRGQSLWAVAALLGAALVKPVALLLAPPLALLVAPSVVAKVRSAPPGQRRRHALVAAAIGLPLLALVALPFLAGLSSGLAMEAGLVLFSTPRLAFLLLRSAGAGLSQGAVLWGATALFLALYAWTMLRAPSFGSFLAVARRALLAFIFLGSSEFQPWYLTWALVFAALEPRLVRWALPLSASCLLSYAVFFWLRYWIHWQQLGVVLAGWACIAAGGVAAWLLGLWARGRTATTAHPAAAGLCSLKRPPEANGNILASFLTRLPTDESREPDGGTAEGQPPTDVGVTSDPHA